ncbi:MAG: prepilin-type N-terminal cleavage/methylation domain-containing protein [Ruminococcaceae bacterium]|nr:prepilin-type N-terminal cleavage/methylation domain-containing protein [Oscillospiraceae bacterium]
MKTNKGFSLVELIVVIAIMAIIAGVAIPVYTTYIDKTNKAADEQLFADIMDVLTYAAVADTTGATGYLGSVILGEDPTSFAGSTAFVQAAIDNAELTGSLKYDGWSASGANNATIIDNSVFFEGTPAEKEVKVEDLLGNVQTLVEAYKEVTGSTNSDANEVVFGVASEAAALSETQIENIATIWEQNFFTSDLMGVYFTNNNELGLDTGIAADNIMMSLAIYYANIKAFVMYAEANVDNVATSGDPEYTSNGITYNSKASKHFYDMTNSLSTLSGAQVVSALISGKNKILENVEPEVVFDYYGLDETANPTADYDERLAARKNDAKAFISTLSIANSKKEDFVDKMDQEDLFGSKEMSDTIISNVTAMNGISGESLSIPSGSSVVISAIKNPDGSVTFVIYK